MKRRLIEFLIVSICILTAIPGIFVTRAYASSVATITVDASQSQGALNRLSAYNNGNSYLGTLDIQQMQTLGTKYSRTFIKPNLYFDPSTGQYNYSYIYNTLDQFSSYSDRILINFGQCSSSIMTLSSPNACRQVLYNGLKNYKTLYPQIQYVEVFNESEAHYDPESLQLSSADYYAWYKIFYGVVNQINSELSPAIPLEMGGPVTSTFSSTYIQAFLDNYANDTDTSKKLSFISYHEYAQRSTPANVQSEKSTVQSWLSSRGIPTNTKVFVTEYGVFPGSNTGTTFNADILTQAAAMATLDYYYELGGMDMPMQWTIRHANNYRKSQLVSDTNGNPIDGAVYPYFNMVQMQTMLKDTRISSSSNSLSSAGLGVNALATKDASGIAIQATNYQWTTGTTEYDTTVNVNNLPAEFTGKQIHVERYLIDQTHSNYTYNSANAGLQKVEDFIVNGGSSSFSQTFHMTVNAMSLLVLTPVYHKEAEGLTISVSTNDSHQMLSDTSASAGYYDKFNGNAVGDYVQYSVNVTLTGTYGLYVRVKRTSDRGKFQLSIDGVNQGNEQDSYLSGYDYQEVYLGNKSFNTTGNKMFKFTITGSSGIGYNLGVDYIRLVPKQTHTYQLESLTPTKSTGDSFYYLSDSGADGGELVKFADDAATDFIQFYINVPQPGIYSLNVGVKKFNTRGIFQLSIDGTNVGSQQDNYAATASFNELQVGTYTFPTQGLYRVKFYISGKNASSLGYDLGLDYIKLVP
ncbi:MAG: hypothetical protein JWM44_3900 [Bacilli bacterium]|nr:hypothetical protein [Bacilli bacterium]